MSKTKSERRRRHRAKQRKEQVKGRGRQELQENINRAVAYGNQGIIPRGEEALTESAVPIVRLDDGAPQIIADNQRNEGVVIVYEPAHSRWAAVREAQYPHSFPYSVQFDVTPQWAMEVLRWRNLNNRRIDKRRVVKYARDMITGHWVVNNDDICFYKDGSLANGQHRLTGVILAKHTVRMSFKFGVPPEAVATIDEGRARTNHDVAQIMGMKTTRYSLAATNFILEDAGIKPRVPRHELLDFNQRHSAASELANTINKRPFHKAPVHAAFIRAYYHIDHDLLRRAAAVLRDGEYDSEEELAMIRLRNYMIANPEGKCGSWRRDLCRRVETALFHFVARTPIEKLYAKAEHLYLLPEEELGEGLFGLG